MKSKPRLLGVDLFRVIAIFGVIILHSDGGAKFLSWNWQLIRCFSGFAVPFFLATSFYLAITKSKKNQFQLGFRLKQLLFPYGIWTIYYLLYKFVKYTLDGDREKIFSLFQDPLSIIFFGSSAIHLYFLPLLAWGTTIVKVIEISSFDKFSLKKLIICFLAIFFIHGSIVLSGNEFKIVAGTAFNTWLPDIQPGIVLRLFLVLSTWTFWCLSYIILAIIIHHSQVNFEITNLGFKSIIILILGFVAFTLIDFAFFYNAPIFEVFRGYIILLIAINWSKTIEKYKIVSILSNCSFGIYLVHLIFIEAFYIIGTRIHPQLFVKPSISLYLTIAFVVLLLSWIFSSLLLINQKTARLFLGYR